jgi:putative RNA 2'-phosphotransferase
MLARTRCEPSGFSQSPTSKSGSRTASRERRRRQGFAGGLARDGFSAADIPRSSFRSAGSVKVRGTSDSAEMDERALIGHSKFLSFVLRHQPDAAGIHLDAQGWVAIDELLDGCRKHGHALTREMLDEIVAKSSKRRLAISEDGMRIRASQGHSIEVDLGYQPVTPPELLFHGTVARHLDAIRAQGLKRMQRHHVHLSPDTATATAVGQRHGRPVILRILAGEMARQGHQFYLSANGVWLTDEVPAAYIEFPEE